MNETEQRLAAWLHDQTPEPLRLITADDVRHERLPHRPARRAPVRRAWFPVLAAVSSVAVVVLLAVLVHAVTAGHRSSPAASTGPSTAQRRCVPSQIQLSYNGAGIQAGVDSGTITVTNLATSPCQLLPAQFVVSPLDGNGKVIATPVGWQNMVLVNGISLRANGVVPLPGQPYPGDRSFDISLAGNGLCPRGAQVTPAAWRVTGSLTGYALAVTVPNVDNDLLAHPAAGQPARLYACANPTLALLNVTGKRG